ncbi:TIGR01458 family HAD-type hydrolase [Maritimibacter sp. 55A14]|uniref:TIGR01458 family HAD-type hydrolase n=1 Tax=Maritimibacter sp. 55A14 TaxID=2174844 RepID=UPI000D60E5A7|nr:TIGR01458 family HAD-type hydrolase [Maritimibacter sp. 55A14]PWE31191.1 TIGR01458 family HAD-type hydrolase [Maritimibacter sp. 55A14]
MVDAVLLDLSGVLYSGSRAVPGAAEAVARLRGAGLGLRFVTNSTRTPRRGLLAKLAGMGIELEEGELFTPARAALDWLEARGLTAHLLIHPDLEEDFTDLPEGGRGRAVVLGDAGEAFTYARLNAAFRELAGGADFLALAANRSFMDADGALSMDAGAFVAALEYASGVEAEVLGKPAPGFFGAALDSLGTAPERAVMVGDDAEADVAGALNAGLRHAVLVRTGKYCDGDETRFDPEPSVTLSDIGAAADWILDRAGA